MPRPRGGPVALAPLLALALVTGPAHGYDVAIHTLLDERAIPEGIASRPLAACGVDDARALRRAIYRAGATHADVRVRERFLGRYPTGDHFDAWAFKEFLALDPTADVFGVDRIPEPSAPLTVGALLALGARQPDDDRRNQSRFAYDSARAVRNDAHGRPLPADPLQLTMGALTGTSSQAHAHYGLPRIEFSDSPDVLETEPWRFAHPPTARAFAAEFAQLHTDLALCAATLDRPGGRALGWLLLGHAHHYVQDVANQIHTLQAIYPFFRDAKVEEVVGELRTLGGLLGSRPDFVTIGIGIIKNHHLLAEGLFARRVTERLAGASVHPAVGEALEGIARGDTALDRALEALGSDPEAAFAFEITDRLIEASSREGGEVYALTRSLARPQLSRWGYDVENDADPDHHLRDRPDPEALERFYRLQAAGFARAGTALRRHVALYEEALRAADRDGAKRRERFRLSAERLIATQLDYLDGRDARLAAYRPGPPREERVNPWVPSGALGLVALLTLAGWFAARLARSRRSAARGA